MNYRKKGISLIGILVIAALVLIIGVLVYLGLHGFGFGKGKGEGSGQESSSLVRSESSEETTAAETTTAETTTTTTTTTPETKELQYVDVTVSGNDYLYQNQKLTLEELMQNLQSLTEAMPVKLTDANASLDAYENLTKALSEAKISYIETSDSETTTTTAVTAE